MRKYEENLCEVSKHCGWKLNLEFYAFAQPRAVRLHLPTSVNHRSYRLRNRDRKRPYSEFRRTSNSVSRSGLRDGKFMVGKVQCFYIVTYGKNKS